MHSASFGRPFGTSAEYVVVPTEHAIELPANTSFEAGACLGVPALTAHRCVFADGPVADRKVLVTGGAGAVGHYAIELTKHGGATVIANGIIATYSSDAVPEPVLPFYEFMRRGITIRTVLVFVMPAAAMQAAVEQVTALLTTGQLTHPVAARYRLDDVVRAHQLVERGQVLGKVLLMVG